MSGAPTRRRAPTAWPPGTCAQSPHRGSCSLPLTVSECRPVSDKVSRPQPMPRATWCFEGEATTQGLGQAALRQKDPRGLIDNTQKTRQVKLLCSPRNTKLKVGSTSRCITVHARQCCNLQPAGDGDGCCKDEAAVQGGYTIHWPCPLEGDVRGGKSWWVAGSLTVALILIHSGGQHAERCECRGREDGALHSHQPGWEESA